MLFIGSYTQMLSDTYGGSGEGIYSVELDYATGEISVLHTMPCDNPSYLALSKTGDYLYCLTELPLEQHPKVKAYRIMEDRSLHFLNERPIPGSYPCHLICEASSLLVACYGSGNVLQFPVGDNGELLENTANYTHKGKGPNTQRQEAPHTHQVVMAPNEKDFFVVDLGIDTLKGYRMDSGELQPNPSQDIPVEKGGGARHAVFSVDGESLYVVNELTATVSVLKKEGGKYRLVNSYPSLPEDYSGMPSASAIRLHPNGKYLYTANRGYEGIAIFEIKGHRLNLKGQQRTGGKTLREFNLSPDGKWLIACHQDSDDTVVFQVQSDGGLSEKYRTKKVVSPVCVVWP